MVALEAADVERLHDAAVAGVAGRRRVDEVLVRFSDGRAGVRMVLDDEVVVDGLCCGERGRCRGLGLAAEGEPGEGEGGDEVLHLEADPMEMFQSAGWSKKCCRRLTERMYGIGVSRVASECKQTSADELWMRRGMKDGDRAFK